MADECYGSDDAVSELLTASSRTTERRTTSPSTATTTAKAARGKTTIDAAMEPVRKLVEEEKTATGITKEKLKSELVKHYAESAEKKMTPEKEKLTTDLLTDSDVKAYVGQLDYDDYSSLRAEIQGIFGGPQARLVEMEFRNAKIPAIVSKLEENGRYTPSIKNAISDIMGEGILSEKNLGKMRELENVAKNDLDDIWQGTSRQTYERMKYTLGETITNELFAMRISDSLNAVMEMTADTGKVSEALGRKLSTDEWKMFDDIEKGKRKADANAFEASVKMIQKLSQSDLDIIRGTIKPLEELDGPSRTAVIQKLNDKWSTTKKAAVVAGTIGAFAWGIGVLLPDKLNNWGQFGLTNAAEMSALFGQFDKDVSVDRLLQLWFPAGDRKTAMELWLKSAKTYIGWMETIYSIPIIGDWYKSMTMVGYTSAIGSLGNFDTKMTELKNKGLAIEDKTTLSGWRETTLKEKQEFYRKDLSAYFGLDADAQKKYSIWNDKTGIYKKGKSGAELTPLQAMAAYYYAQGQYNIQLSDYGLTSGDVSDESMMIEVNKYGEKYGIKETTLPTGSGSASSSNAYEKAIENAMKREGLTREQAIRNVEAEVKFMGERDGMTREDALLKLTGIGGGSRSGGGSGGSSSSSRSDESSYEYDEKKSEKSKTIKAMPSASQQQSLNQVKRGEKELSYEDVNALKVEGKVDIKTAKENGITISDLAAKDKEATVGGFGTYAEQMKEEKKIDKSDWNQMKTENKDAAREALRSAYGCGN